MYSEKLVKYYEDLWPLKDYEKKSLFIERNCNLDKLLDVGCGTASHLGNFYKEGRSVYRIDTSADMLGIAANNAQGNFSLKNCSVDQFTEDCDFTTVISMFNAVNNLLSLEELEKYFHHISLLLSPEGTFIFDCFNACAVFQNTPQDTRREISSQTAGGSYLLSGKSTFDAMNSSLKMSNNVKVFHLGSQVDEFDYDLEHTIWSSNLLASLVEKYSMRVTKVVSNLNYTAAATAEDYKITFVCKKGNP